MSERFFLTAFLGGVSGLLAVVGVAGLTLKVESFGNHNLSFMEDLAYMGLFGATFGPLLCFLVYVKACKRSETVDWRELQCMYLGGRAAVWNKL